MFCTKCGKEYSEEEKVCSKCGAELNPTQINQQSNDFGSFGPSKKNDKNVKIIGVLMFFVLSWIGLFIGLAMYNGEDRKYFVKGWFAPLKWILIFCGVLLLITGVMSLFGVEY